MSFEGKCTLQEFKKKYERHTDFFKLALEGKSPEVQDLCLTKVKDFMLRTLDGRLSIFLGKQKTFVEMVAYPDKEASFRLSIESAQRLNWKYSNAAEMFTRYWCIWAGTVGDKVF